MDFSLLLLIGESIVYLFAPSLLLSYLTGFKSSSFIVYIAIFAYIGGAFNIFNNTGVSVGFMMTGIFLTCLFIYFVLINKGDSE